MGWVPLFGLISRELDWSKANKKHCKSKKLVCGEENDNGPCGYPGVRVQTAWESTGGASPGPQVPHLSHGPGTESTRGWGSACSCCLSVLSIPPASRGWLRRLPGRDQQGSVKGDVCMSTGCSRPWLQCPRLFPPEACCLHLGFSSFFCDNYKYITGGLPSADSEHNKVSCLFVKVANSLGLHSARGLRDLAGSSWGLESRI